MILADSVSMFSLHGAIRQLTLSSLDSLVKFIVMKMMRRGRMIMYVSRGGNFLPVNYQNFEFTTSRCFFTVVLDHIRAVRGERIHAQS